TAGSELILQSKPCNPGGYEKSPLIKEARSIRRSGSIEFHISTAGPSQRRSFGYSLKSRSQKAARRSASFAREVRNRARAAGTESERRFSSSVNWRYGLMIAGLAKTTRLKTV